MKKRIVGLLAVMVLLASLLAIPSMASAAEFATVSIGATPYYLCMTLTFNDAHDGSWAVGITTASTVYWWDDEGGAQVSPFPGALANADCAGNITNCGTVTSDITVECADFTGGATGWNLTVGAPGENTVQVTAYMEGCADEATGTEVDNAPTDLQEDMTALQVLGVELSLETGTFTDGDAKASTGVVFTITAPD